MLRIGDAYYRLRDGLRAIYDEGEASALAHLVMETLTGMSRLERLTRKYENLDEVPAQRFLQMERALLAGQPLQYVLGETHFMGRVFQVNASVLIPRPETEELVEWILKDESPESILDVGTGSGCIAISLALGLSDCAVTAIDVSLEALEIAMQNAKTLAAQLTFRKCDFLNAAERDLLPAFSVIVSNPPYIPQNESGSLHRNVRDFEPATALFVPENDALLFYRTLAEFGKKHLQPRGRIYCELHQDYAQACAEMFREQGYRDVELRRDAFGNYRMVRGVF